MREDGNGAEVDKKGEEEEADDEDTCDCGDANVGVWSDLEEERPREEVIWHEGGVHE